MDNNFFLEARNVVKRYANHTALKGVSIEVPEGKVFGLLGPNGAGKTTLIRIINRITAPDSGEVFFNGHQSCANDIYNIGYLPEERGLYKKMKVGEQAIYLAQLKGLSKKEATERLKVWFNKFEITPWWDKKLEELSKGMQQKVQFIITVLHKPQLLIFDEPFSGFDPVNAELLKREILELKKQGHTIIFSTHNMASVEEICDNIALINHSEVVLKGNVNEVRSRFKTNTYKLEIPHHELLTESDSFNIISKEEKGENLLYTLKKKEDINNSQLLSEIASRNEIISFSECLPSMNEIFIRTVEGEKSNSNKVNEESK
ncbi:MAG: ABC transporter ATP-binding protein [Phocaeicola sp.]|nr:ABC transporter ATP-binding protein [Phocaeicola sp.]